ncbi:hypothetical protein GNI_131400, partial [Gregarina niphandrodes]
MPPLGVAYLLAVLLAVRGSFLPEDSLLRHPDSLANPAHLGRVAQTLNDQVVNTYDIFTNDAARLVNGVKRRITNVADSHLAAKEEMAQVAQDSEKHPKRLVASLFGITDPERFPLATSVQEFIDSGINVGYRAAFSPIASTIRFKRAILKNPTPLPATPEPVTLEPIPVELLPVDPDAPEIPPTPADELTPGIEPTPLQQGPTTMQPRILPMQQGPMATPMQEAPTPMQQGLFPLHQESILMPFRQRSMPMQQPGMMPMQQPGMMPMQQPGMMPMQQPGMMQQAGGPVQPTLPALMYYQHPMMGPYPPGYYPSPSQPGFGGPGYGGPSVNAGIQPVTTGPGQTFMLQPDGTMVVAPGIAPAAPTETPAKDDCMGEIEQTTKVYMGDDGKLHMDIITPAPGEGDGGDAPGGGDVPGGGGLPSGPTPRGGLRAGPGASPGGGAGPIGGGSGDVPSGGGGDVP